MELALYAVLKAGNREDFGVQALDGQEQDCEIGGVGDIYVFLADVLGFIQDPALKCFSENLDGLDIACLCGGA